MPKLSCFVVGEGAIALKCLQILWRAKHNILGIYTSDRALNAWADEQGILQANSRDRLRDWLLTVEYDYLFSINNGWIIPPEIIARPGRIINYHNSPLPKYAGLHATSWALLKGETQHAVSWHKVVTEIDAGAIFKQPIIPIQPDDTALSLNTHCFEVAIESFTALVEELADDRAPSFAQDLSQRSYFGLGDRPAAACLLSFDQPTQDLYNLVRALDFRPTHNPLGLAKIWLPSGVVGAGQASAIAASHAATLNCPAGKVLALNEQGLQIATLDSAIELSRLTTLEGIPLDATMLSDRYGVRVGDILPTLSTQVRQAISQQNTTICRYERTWVKQLTKLSPFVHPYLQIEGGNEVMQALHRYAIELPQLQPRCSRDVAPSLPFAEADVWLLATFAAYCARLATASEFDLLLQTQTQHHLTAPLFAQSVPIRVQTDQGEALTQFYDRFQTVLTRTLRLGSYARDVFARYPELQQEAKPLAVAIVLLPKPADLEFSSLDASMALVAYENGDAPELVHAGALNDSQSEAIVRQLQAIMTACLDNSDQPLQTLPLLAAAERQQILAEWNQTAKPYPSDCCIHTLISAQVAKTPDAPAVSFRDMQLSYRELEQRSNQLAHWLVQLGIKPDDRVGLCLPRSVDLIVGLLGILKAGGAYVPIDLTYPVDRIAYLIEDSCPQIILTTGQLRSRLSKQDNVVCLDDHAATLSQFSVEPVATQVTPQHLAYMIYTSGSTGKPKGVKIEHRSVVNHSWAVADAFELDGGDRVLQSASISFDIAGEQIYPALLRGAEVVLRPDDLLESLDRFTRFIDSQAITVMILPTVFWHEWVAELVAFNQPVPPSLRLISVGTEKVLSTRLNQWQTVSAGRVTFFQGYGPTEATITCTLYKHDGRSFRMDELPPIGRPLPNTEAYILDPQLEPVPIGVVGELYVGGDGLARGYHQRPDLTAQQFIAHPFRDQDTARLYKTGDLARFQSDGQIVYCGRADHQIKLHGFRIELGEIEAALHECQGVKQAVVIVRETAETRSLVAYVVPWSEQTLTVTHLQALLKLTLPSYMLPASIILISALPLTPNGKVDRQALPNPIVDQNEMAAIAPRDDLERQLVQLWKAVGIKPTSITDDFFALGGHSLAAVRLADRIQTTFQQHLPLAVIFQAPTIEQFAAVLRQEQPLPSSALVALQPNGSQTPLFLFQGIDLYRSLAVHLAPDRPVYGLSLGIMDNNGTSFTSIESLASHYIQEISTVQPVGPYYLGGVSLGGMVALEVAQQLQANHHAIALLALFDTPAPNASSLKPLPKRLMGHINNLLKAGPNYVLRKLAIKLHKVSYKLLKLTNRTSSKATQYKFVQEVYKEMRTAYHPQVYLGRIALFLAIDRSDIQDSVFDSALVDIDPQFGWGNLAQGQLDIYQVPGDHLGILKEPQVKVLAQTLKRLLQDEDEAR